MAKRQTFYAQADLFEADISPRAKLVLAYLSRVSDKQGVSFPSVPTIAEKCGCCPNSARKALRELEGAGFIAVEAATLPTRSGKTRWTSNRYTLLFVRGGRQDLHTPKPSPLGEGGTSCAQRVTDEGPPHSPQGAFQAAVSVAREKLPRGFVRRPFIHRKEELALGLRPVSLKKLHRSFFRAFDPHPPQGSPSSTASGPPSPKGEG